MPAMDTPTINIVGVGLSTSLGGYRDACAAYRAGLNRFSAHSMATHSAGEDEPTPLTVAPAAGNLFIYQGVARSVKLLEQAYADLLQNLGHQQLPEDNLLILFAMPDPEDRALDFDLPVDVNRADRLQDYLERITTPFFNRAAPALKQAPMQCVFGDRVAFARTLQKANDILSSGDAQHCLLIVADSLVNDDMLEYQLDNNWLKTPDNPVGYIPGEGAAIFLLSHAANKHTSIACRLAVALDADKVDPEDADATRELWQANKLTTLFKSLVPANKEVANLPQLICDINGEERRAKELGFLHFNLKKHYPNATITEPQIPALSFGETGTMSGPLALASILAAKQRGYARHHSYMICLSEDSGKRAIALAHLPAA